MSRGRVIAFAGPCLPAAPEARWPDLLADVQLWPPARRGDVLVALSRRPEVLVLLDGYYYREPAVTHKELLYALESGVAVIGAASLGALRAAEMEAFGMIGVGEVFGRYRDGEIDGDDEVAILHASAELGFRPLTRALVELRSALAQLVDEGLVSAADAGRLIAAFKELPFTERSPRRLDHQSREILGAAADTLRRRLESDSVKQRDAVLALQRAGAIGAPAKRRAPVEVSTFLSFFREWCLREAADDGVRDTPTYAHAWSSVQVLHPEAAEQVRALRVRFLLCSAAMAAGTRLEPSRVEAAAETLDRHLASLPGRIGLPDAELYEEAEMHLLAEAARSENGSLDAAVAPLAERFGTWEMGGGERLLGLIGQQDDLMPQWYLIRAFLFSPAAAAALEVAHHARAIHDAFLAWSAGVELSPAELTSLARRLWRCREDEVPRKGSDRGLFRSHGFAAGLEDALQRIAPAERLVEPLNPYPEARDRLVRAPLGHVLDLRPFRRLPTPCGDQRISAT